jgi:hypothetical protein
MILKFKTMTFSILNKVDICTPIFTQPKIVLPIVLLVNYEM